ncbi:BCL-6 corepressor-like protein 1 [Cotesia glomerata]|uniref:BCL-6 corepressor-like protein 1 n=1 Tax=Cotesia glomerata TaxID=32391 RepID=UPI001D0250FC|nr:BCL-6 corepressor-like protein 1 [Cotesia glomerata]
MNTELSPSQMACSAMMYRCIKDHQFDYIKLLLENGMDVNQPIITTGEFAGYTALHVACMEDDSELVRLLVENYGADVNAMAADGTQPILLACFYEKCHDDLCECSEESTTGILAHAKANNDIEFGPEILSKHFKNRHWYTDFGDKIPLVAYLIFNDET